MESMNKMNELNIEISDIDDDDEDYDAYTAADYEIISAGYVNYNGIIAEYEHGEEEELMATNRIFGSVENLPNAGIVLEGDGIEGLKKDIRSAVDDLFEDFDQYGTPRRKFNAAGTLNATIEFYVHDPVILNFFYNRYPHKKKIVQQPKVVPFHPRFEEQEVPFRMAA
jgi:predicted HicB family RNase H-like nuclease